MRVITAVRAAPVRPASRGWSKAWVRVPMPRQLTRIKFSDSRAARATPARYTAVIGLPPSISGGIGTYTSPSTYSTPSVSRLATMDRAWLTQSVTASQVAVAPEMVSTALLPEERMVPDLPLY